VLAPARSDDQDSARLSPRAGSLPATACPPPPDPAGDRPALPQRAAEEQLADLRGTPASRPSSRSTACVGHGAVGRCTVSAARERGGQTAPVLEADQRQLRGTRSPASAATSTAPHGQPLVGADEARWPVGLSSTARADTGPRRCSGRRRGAPEAHQPAAVTPANPATRSRSAGSRVPDQQAQSPVTAASSTSPPAAGLQLVRRHVLSAPSVDAVSSTSASTSAPPAAGSAPAPARPPGSRRLAVPQVTSLRRSSSASAPVSTSRQQ
jgi:hypothetical protein